MIPKDEPVEVTTEQFANACYWLEHEPEMSVELLNMKIEWDIYQKLVGGCKTEDVVQTLTNTLREFEANTWYDPNNLPKQTKTIAKHNYPWYHQRSFR